MKECVDADMADCASCKAGCTSSQNQSSQPCTLRVRTRSTRPTVSSEMVSATDREVRLSVLSASITWFLAPHAAYIEAYFRKHAKDAVVMKEL